jgi:hypothetical protein
VRPFLHTRFCAPLLRDGELVAVAVEDKSGRRAIQARYFVDATGDADLITRLGLPIRRHDPLQPPTTCVHLHGLDELRQANPGLDIAQVVFDPTKEGALPRGFFWHAEVPGVPNLRMLAGTRVNHADCSDADQLTRAELEGRRQVRAIADFYRRHLAGGDKIMVAALPARIGTRETRKIEGLYHLTEAEVLAGTAFPDTIAQGCYRVDVHHSDKPGLTFRYLDGTESYVVPGHPAVKGRWRPPQPVDPTYYQVPYRCLVPRGARNVLGAGRLIDTDPGANGAVRVMVNCNQTGEAAGAACVLALQGGLTVDQVDPQALRTVLRQGGSAL